MSVTPFLAEIDSLPNLVDFISSNIHSASLAISSDLASSPFGQIFLTGCGDSHHAAVCTRFAFESFTKIPTQALPAMDFSRYRVSHIADRPSVATLVIGISASGEVSRTIEGIELAKRAGATTVAITGNSQSELARTAHYTFFIELPPFTHKDVKVVVPGTRSYMASLLALFHLSLSMAEIRQTIQPMKAQPIRGQLLQLPDFITTIIEDNRSEVENLAQSWLDAEWFVFCGSGPNTGTAMFSAAKILEASGDQASFQDLEEWAHLEYFSRRADTPTFLIQGGKRDQDRVFEIAIAARAIGRRVALICSNSPIYDSISENIIRLPVPVPIAECFSPILMQIPGLLFAEARARLISEPYFRGFGGGRSVEGGGGVSSIRSSQRLNDLPD